MNTAVGSRFVIVHAWKMKRENVLCLCNFTSFEFRESMEITGVDKGERLCVCFLFAVGAYESLTLLIPEYFMFITGVNC